MSDFNVNAFMDEVKAKNPAQPEFILLGTAMNGGVIIDEPRKSRNKLVS